jgi:epoxyqueuosine reductase
MSTPVVAAALELRLKQRANEIGFDPVGITHLGPVESYGAFARWLENGYSGEMTYLPRGAEKRRDTRSPVPGARSAIVVALDYGGKQPPGSIARYARGDDYHDVMLDRLRELHRWLERECGHAVAGKAYVDTGPILERDLAQRAGLGWIGKNTMLINPKRGSFFFLGALLVDLELEPDAPFESDRCGTCTRCLDASTVPTLHRSSSRSWASYSMDATSARTCAPGITSSRPSLATRRWPRDPITLALIRASFLH